MDHANAEPALEERATFSLRFKAYLIDAAIILFTTWIAAYTLAIHYYGDWAAFVALFEDTVTLENRLAELKPWLTAINLFSGSVTMLYYTFEALTAQSIGKRMFKLWIRQANGSPAPTMLLWQRWSLKVASALFGVVAILSGITALENFAVFLSMVYAGGCFWAIDPQRLAMHDRILQTQVSVLRSR